MSIDAVSVMDELAKLKGADTPLFIAVQRVCPQSLLSRQLVNLHALIVAKFDEVVGFSYLRGLHLNDSKEGLNSKRDRHEHIGLYVLPLSSPYHRVTLRDSLFIGGRSVSRLSPSSCAIHG